MGFGLGYAVGGLFLWTAVGALAGVGLGLVLSRRAAPLETLTPTQAK